MLDILRTLQRNALSTVGFFMVGSSVTKAIIPCSFVPDDVDIFIRAEHRQSRVLTESMFRALFDVTGIEWSDGEQYKNTLIRRRTIVTLADGRKIDFLVLAENATEYCFTSEGADSTAAQAFIKCNPYTDSCGVYCSDNYVESVIQKTSPVMIWGGTKEFKEKTLKRFDRVKVTDCPPKSSLHNRPRLRTTLI